MTLKAKESKKVLRAQAKKSTASATGEHIRADPIEKTKYVCNDCIHHDNHPSYCNEYKKYVKRKQNQCDSFK